MRDMVRRALRRGLDELESRSSHRHAERAFDLPLNFWAAEAAVTEVVAQVFEQPVAGPDWETSLSAFCFSDDDYQQTVKAVCRESDPRATDVRLKASVSSVPDAEEQAGRSFGLMRDPPAAVFDPVIRDLEAVAAEVMGRIPGSKRGRLRRRFEAAEFDLHLPLPRLESVGALLLSFKNLPSYEGEVALTTFLRMDGAPLGAATVALHAWLHQEPDDSVVSASVECLLRSVEDRPEVEKRLDQVVALLKAIR